MEIEEGMLVRVKDKVGVVVIPSRPFQTVADLTTGDVVDIRTLNNIKLEDGITVMVSDNDIEEYVEGE